MGDDGGRLSQRLTLTGRRCQQGRDPGAHIECGRTMPDESVFYAHFKHYAHLGVVVAAAVLNALFLSTEWNEFRRLHLQDNQKVSQPCAGWLHRISAPYWDLARARGWVLHVLLHLAKGSAPLSQASF